MFITTPSFSHSSFDLVQFLFTIQQTETDKHMQLNEKTLLYNIIEKIANNIHYCSLSRKLR